MNDLICKFCSSGLKPIHGRYQCENKLCEFSYRVEIHQRILFHEETFGIKWTEKRLGRVYFYNMCYVINNIINEGRFNIVEYMVDLPFTTNPLYTQTFSNVHTIEKLITLSFKTAQEKEFLRLNLMQHLAKIDLSGYIIIFDATCTILNQKTGDREVSDAVTRTLYTQKERLQEIVFYKDKKIIKKQKIKTSAAFDNWDLWNNGLKYNDKNDAEYQKYKKENPELYKDIPQ